VLLPFLNCLVEVAQRRFTHKHREDTLAAHAGAAGTEPYGRDWFDQFLSKAEFSVVVFYRGLW
jgi:hypothetical protein